MSRYLANDLAVLALFWKRSGQTALLLASGVERLQDNDRGIKGARGTSSTATFRLV
jgi:hypothetical protein